MILKVAKEKNGITLIALVITIIVLLILAGVTIATLTGDNGILTRASEAAERTGEANAREKVQLAVAGSIGTDGKINIDDLNTELSKVEGLTSGVPISGLPADVIVDGYTITISENGSVNLENTETSENIKEYTEDGVPIPNGFYYVGGTKDTGVVISDIEGDDLENTKGGNQFVWVPVVYSEFERREGYSNEALQKPSVLANCGEADSTGKNTNHEIAESSTTQREAQKMYTSVQKNNGFYIGRYETGKDTNENVVIQKGANVYNNVTWSKNGSMNEEDEVSGTEENSDGAIELARNFDTGNGYTSVNSTLIYGVQWDAVMKWMEEIRNSNADGIPYIQNSTGMGWYNNNYSSGNPNHQTGIDVDSKSNCINNIYDLAGNVLEWTMESLNTNNRVYRGGGYGSTGYAIPASARVGKSPSYGYTNTGFRVTLYIK